MADAKNLLLNRDPEPVAESQEATHRYKF